MSFTLKQQSNHAASALADHVIADFMILSSQIFLFIVYNFWAVFTVHFEKSFSWKREFIQAGSLACLLYTSLLNLLIIMLLLVILTCAVILPVLKMKASWEKRKHVPLNKLLCVWVGVTAALLCYLHNLETGLYKSCYKIKQTASMAAASYALVIVVSLKCFPMPSDFQLSYVNWQIWFGNFWVVACINVVTDWWR